MSFDFVLSYETASTWDEFLAAAPETHRRKWNQSLQSVQLTGAQRAALAVNRRRLFVLCMAASWCGDCAEQCPIIAACVAACPGAEARWVDRDVDGALAAELTICGAPRIPHVVFLSEDFDQVARYGDRPLAKYRALGMAESDAAAGGATCSTGSVSAADPLRQALIQEWVDQFERVAWILRLSPKLRQRYND